MQGMCVAWLHSRGNDREQVCGCVTFCESCVHFDFTYSYVHMNQRLVIQGFPTLSTSSYQHFYWIIYLDLVQYFTCIAVTTRKRMQSWQCQNKHKQGRDYTIKAKGEELDTHHQTRLWTGVDQSCINVPTIPDYSCTTNNSSREKNFKVHAVCM